MSSYIRLDSSTLEIKAEQVKDILKEIKEKFKDREWNKFSDVLKDIGFEYEFDEDELKYTFTYGDTNELYEMEDIFNIIAKYVDKEKRMIMVISYLDYNERSKFVFYNGECQQVGEIKRWADDMDIDF